MLRPVRGACRPDRPRRRRAGPRDLVPGGSMSFAGIRNDRQLDDLVAFLRQT
jgi:hypothetical protein